MATILKKFTVCDGCKGEVDTTPYRVGGLTGNTKQLDLCEDCKARPFTEVLAMGAVPRRRGRPVSTTVEQVEAIAREQAAAKPARKRAARKVAEVKA